MNNRISSDGKGLEKLVALIYETLKNNFLAEVLHDQKLPNSIGGTSQFDVIIKSKVAGFDLLIAIECKDYNKPVGISEIHDFRGKCDLVNGISRKIFVAVNGYQSGAKGAAEKFGIDIYDLKEISTELLSGWIVTDKIRFSYPDETRIGPITFFTKDGQTLRYPKETIGRDFCLYEIGKSPLQLYYIVNEVLKNSMKESGIVNYITEALDEKWDKINLIEYENEIVVSVTIMFNLSGRRFGAIIEKRLQELKEIGIAVEYVYSVAKADNVIARIYRHDKEMVAETVSGLSGKFKFEIIKDASSGLTKIYAFDSLGRVIEFNDK